MVHRAHDAALAQRHQETIDAVLIVIHAHFQVEERALTSQYEAGEQEALAREIAVYLLAKVMGVPYAMIMAQFHRERAVIDQMIASVMARLATTETFRNLVAEIGNEVKLLIIPPTASEPPAHEVIPVAPATSTVATAVESLATAVQATDDALAQIRARREPRPAADPPPLPTAPEPLAPPLLPSPQPRVTRVRKRSGSPARPKPLPKPVRKKKRQSPIAALFNFERDELRIALEVADLKASMGKRPSKHFLFPSRARPEYHRAMAHELRRLGLAHLIPQKNRRPASRSRK